MLNAFNKRDYVPHPNKFFQSEAWTKLRKKVIKRDKICKLCGKATCLTVHHIKPRSEGGSNDERNLETLCEDCHNKVEEGESTVPEPPEVGLDWHEWVYGGFRNPAYFDYKINEK